MPDDKAEAAPHGEPGPQVGDAGLLFQDKSPAQPAAPAPQPAPESGEVFDLVDVPDWAADWAPAQNPSVPQARPGQPAASKPEAGATTARARDETRLDPSALVEETWSRWSEWGTSLIVVGVWSTAMLLLVYFVFGTEFHALAFVLLLVGVIVAVVLSYPMLITLDARFGSHPSRPCAIIMVRCRTMSPTSAGCGCCSAQPAGFPARTGHLQVSKDTGKSNWLACGEGTLGR